MGKNDRQDRGRNLEALEASCPIPNTHRRLADAHRHWHQTARFYNDPDGFRMNLNTTIQELRNVTFILQKDQSAIPNFAGWYSDWQALLRADETARWLIGARNHLVKQGDLDTVSRVTATVLSGYNRQEVDIASIPPTSSNRTVARYVAASMPEHLRPDGAIEVRRYWSVSELGARELLDALAHCFGLLQRLLESAHERCKSPYIPVACDGRHNGPRGAPICMFLEQSARTTIVAAENGARLRRQTYVQNWSEEKIIESRSRYGDSGVVYSDKPLAEQAALLHANARRIFNADGYHLMFVFLYSGKKLIEMRGLHSTERYDNHLLLDDMANYMRFIGADGFAIVGESWKRYPASGDDESHQERGEALFTIAASAEGAIRVISSEIVRSKGKAELVEPADLSPTQANVQIVMPLLRALQCSEFYAWRDRQ